MEEMQSFIRSREPTHTITRKRLPSPDTRVRNASPAARGSSADAPDYGDPASPYVSAGGNPGYEKSVGHAIWLREYFSCFLALIAVAAIVAVLATHQNAPLPQWPSLLSLNSLVAIFSSILKAAMLFPIAEGIGELKWIWFAAPHRASDFDRFDSATRGPWGSFQLIWRFPHNILVCLGALITILALAMDPFTQQILQYYNCPTALDGTPFTVSRTNNYTAAGYHQAAGEVSLDGPMAVALYQGLLSPPANASASISNSCQSGNCTFTAANTSVNGTLYRSLAMCSHVDDISYLISGNGTFNNYSLPSGPQLAGSVLFSSVSVIGLENGTEDSPLFAFEALMVDVKGNGTGLPGQAPFAPWAFGAYLYPCVHTYGDTNVTDSIFQERIVSTVSLPYVNVDGGYYSLAGDYPSFPGMSCTPSEKAEGNNAQPTSLLSNGLRYVNISYDAAAADPETLWYNPACTYEFSIGPTMALPQYLGTAFFGYSGHTNDLSTPYGSAENTVGDFWIQRLYANGTANLTSVTAYMEGLANSMTAVIRQRGDLTNSAPAQGLALGNQTCVRVQWAWFAYPVALLLLAIFFLVATVLKSQRYIRKGAVEGGRGPWKSSSMPLLWCGLPDATKMRYGTLEEVKAMRKRGDELTVTLRLNKAMASEEHQGMEYENERGKWGLREEVVSDI